MIIYEFSEDEWNLLERFVKINSDSLTPFLYDDINEYLVKHRKDRSISDEIELYLLINVIAYLKENYNPYNKVINISKREIKQNENFLEVKIERFKKIFTVLNTIYFEKYVNEESESQNECQ